MKAKTKNFLIIIFSLFAILLAIFLISQLNSNNHSAPKKIAPYLFEITYNDYQKDTEFKTLKTLSK